MSHYPHYFAVIAHNTEQYRSFGSGLPPKEWHITPSGKFLSSLGISDEGSSQQLLHWKKMT